MFPNGLRVLTSEILKKNAMSFNILWHNEKNALIEIAKKPINNNYINYINYNNEFKKYLENDYSDIPDYDKEVNPFLL